MEWENSWLAAFPSYNPATATFADYEAAYALYLEDEADYYSVGDPRFTAPKPPPKPPGYDQWKSSGLAENVWRDQQTEAEASAEFAENTELLLPWLPDNLIGIYAEAWKETGDPNLAMATLRASSEYDAYFTGIKRDDGTLRMTEQEWFATREAYTVLLNDFGLNPGLFTDQFDELMVGNVSPSEFASRLGAAYENIVTNIPQVREFYASNFGLEMTDQAIFASFIDPTIGEGILNHRIAIAQVGGQGLAHGFDVNLQFATSLADAGLSQQGAGEFFTSAESQLPILETLALRHNDPDDTFDLGEFADAAIFGDNEEARRIRRLLDAEASSFTDQLGAFATEDSFQVTGLQPI